MVTLVPLQLQSLYIPIVNDCWHLRVGVVNVVPAHSSEEFSLSVTILPLFELPVLSIDEDSNDTRPSALGKVGHTVIDIELNHFVADSTTDSDHLAGHEAGLGGLGNWLFLIVTIFEEALDIGQG